MSANYRKLGDYITQRREKNTAINLPICGVCREGLIPPKQQDADISLYNVFYKNDFIFNPARMELNSITLNTEYDKAICSSLYEIFYINDTSKLLPEFLFVQLKTDNFVRFCEFQGQGSVREYCRFANISEYPVIVPDLKEQEKIVNTYNAITKRIQLKQKINENLKKTAQTIFKKTFEEKLVSNQRKVPLSELCLTVTKGTTPTTLGYDFTKEGINFLKGESITDTHFFDNTKFDHINDEANQALKRSIIFEDDILFSMAGTIGKFAIADKSILPANTNQAVCIIRCNKKKINPLYVYSFLIGNWHIEYYTRRIQEAVQANLSLENIKSLPIVMLEDSERTQYERKVFPLFYKILNNHKEISKLQEFKQLVISRISGM